VTSNDIAWGSGVIAANSSAFGGSAYGNLWTQGNVLLLRVNDNLASASSSQAVYLDEVDPATGEIVSVFGPLAGNTPGSLDITLSQQYPRDAWMQNTQDGKLLTFMAMDVPVGAQW
jgi:hypothetical protein